MNTEANTLATVMDRSHKAILEALAQLEGQDLHRRFRVGEQDLNSAYWILAHLCGSQNWLVLRGSGGPFSKYSWAKHFGMGSTGDVPADAPSVEEFLAIYEEVHQASMKHVLALDHNALSAPHQALMQLPGGSDVRTIIMHHILHESGHCGQLATLCSLYGRPIR